MKLTPILREDVFLEMVNECVKHKIVTQAGLGRPAGLNQAQVNKILHNKRGFSYGEAYSFIETILSRTSLIPLDRTAYSLGTSGGLEWAYEDEKLCDVVERMYTSKLSQLPVKNHEGELVGVVTEETILRRLQYPEADEAGDITAFADKTLKDAGVYEELPKFPEDTSLAEASQVLQQRYAILFEKNGFVTGIITRADLLKLLKK